MKPQKTGILLLALLLAAMVMVPIVSADGAGTDLANKWQADHTIKVTKTVSTHYSNGTLTTDTTYTGTELTKRFGIEKFSVQNKVNISSGDAAKLSLDAKAAAVTSTGSNEVFTAANDPPQLMRSGYPVWIYEYSGGVYHQLTEPINMIWAGAYPSTIKTEMTEKGWWDTIAEDTYYIYDGSWKADDGVASDPVRLFGGNHIRLWQLNTGEVVGAAHEDSSVPHHAVGFESAENLITTFYQDADDTLWHVYPDNTWLGNYVSSPYSDGYATYIGYW
jgi:hypothetical protein